MADVFVSYGKQAMVEQVERRLASIQP